MQQTKKGRGCLFFGCLVAGILLFAIILVAFLGWRYARGLVNQFTDAQPLPLPEIKLAADEATQLRNRIESFRKAVEEDKPTEPLVLTADEINGCIATDPNLAALKGHLHVTIEDSRINAQLSVPAEDLGLDSLRGRYINATGTFAISLTNGSLQVTSESLSGKGKPLPEYIMRQIRGRNLAEKFNSDAQAKAALRQLDSIQVQDGKIIITPKKTR
jgi:hypothetical protein